MTSVGILNWSLPPALDHLGRLPIKLLTEEGRVAAHGLSGRDIEVPEGSYFLSCGLPNGREVIRRKPIGIEAGIRIDPIFPFLELELAVEESQAAKPGADPAAPTGQPAPLSADSPGILLGAEIASDPPAAAAALPATFSARMWAGDWMAQWDKGAGEGQTVDPGGFRNETIALSGDQPIPISGEAGRDLLLELMDGETRRFFVVPFDRAILSGSGEAAIDVSLAPDPQKISLHFASPVSAEANAFVEFVNHGLLDQSRAITADLVAGGEDALREQETSALRAMLGAYVLLRANTLDGFEDWIARLAELMPQVPDVHIVRMEALSRLGKHGEAIAALRIAVTRGCPWFRSGISYLLERLRLYIEVDAETSDAFNLTKDDRARFMKSKTRLENMARRLDCASLFAAFCIPGETPRS